MNDELPNWVVVLMTIFIILLLGTLVYTITECSNESLIFYCPECKTEVKITVKKANEISSVKMVMTHFACGKKIVYEYEKPKIEINIEEDIYGR